MFWTAKGQMGNSFTLSNNQKKWRKKHQNKASFQITSIFIESFKSVKSKMKTNIESVNRFNLFHNQIQWVHQKMWLEWVQGALLKWDSIGRWQKKAESIQRYKWKTESHDIFQLQHRIKSEKVNWKILLKIPLVLS